MKYFTVYYYSDIALLICLIFIILDRWSIDR